MLIPFKDNLAPMVRCLPALRHSFRRYPTLYGLVLGPLLCGPFLLLMDSVWLSLAKDGHRLFGYDPSLNAAMWVIRSVLGGVLFGALSTNLWASWLARDSERLWRSTWAAGGVLGLLAPIMVVRVVFTLYISVGDVLVPFSLAWKVERMMLTLATNVPFVWSSALVLTGTLLSQRLKDENRREQP